MRPLAQSDGHDAPGLIDELVPSVTAMVDEIVVGFEDAIGEPLWLQSGRSPILVPARAKKPHRDAGTQAVSGYIVKILYLAA